MRLQSIIESFCFLASVTLTGFDKVLCQGCVLAHDVQGKTALSIHVVVTVVAFGTTLRILFQGSVVEHNQQSSWRHNI